MRKNMYRFYFFCHDCCWHYIAYLHSCDELCASRGRCTRTYCCCCANYGAQSVRHKLHLAACRTSPPSSPFPLYSFFSSCCFLCSSFSLLILSLLCSALLPLTLICWPMLYADAARPRETGRESGRGEDIE